MFVQCEMYCIKIKMKKYKRVSYLCVSSRISVLAVYPSACAIKHWHFDRNAGERNKRCIRGDERVLIHNQAVFHMFGRFHCIRRLVCIIGRLSLRLPEMPCGSDDSPRPSSSQRGMRSQRGAEAMMGRENGSCVHMSQNFVLTISYNL